MVSPIVTNPSVNEPTIAISLTFLVARHDAPPALGQLMQVSSSPPVPLLHLYHTLLAPEVLGAGFTQLSRGAPHLAAQWCSRCGGGWRGQRVRICATAHTGALLVQATWTSASKDRRWTHITSPSSISSCGGDGRAEGEGRVREMKGLQGKCAPEGSGMQQGPGRARCRAHTHRHSHPLAKRSG